MDRRNGFPRKIRAGLPVVPVPRGMALNQPKALKSFSVFPPGKSLSSSSSKSNSSLDLQNFAQAGAPSICGSLCATKSSAASQSGFQGFRISGFQSFGDVLGTVKVLGKAGRKHGQLLPAFSPHPCSFQLWPSGPCLSSSPKGFVPPILTEHLKSKKRFRNFSSYTWKGRNPTRL